MKTSFLKLSPETILFFMDSNHFLESGFKILSWFRMTLATFKNLYQAKWILFIAPVHCPLEKWFNLRPFFMENGKEKC